MKHTDEMTCLLYLDGQLDPGRAAELAAHTGACDGCRALLNALKRESLALEEALQEEAESVPARVVAGPGRESLAWAWLTALGLAATGAYLFWVGLIEPWQRQLEQAGFGGSNLLSTLLFGGVFWEGWRDMITLVEILAAVTLGVLALVLLGWTRRRGPAMGVMLALLACLALPVPASATEFKTKQRQYRLPRGETLHNDLVVTGDRIVIDGTVEGDLIVFCRTLTVNGRVTGDVLAFAQVVRIEDGEDAGVGGNVRVFANTLVLDAPVERNVTFFVENGQLDAGARIGGGVMAFVATLTVDGRVTRDLNTFAKSVFLSGTVGGDLQARGESLTIGEGAEVQGRARFRGAKEPTVSPQARLASPLEVEITQRVSKYSRPSFYLWQLVRLGAAFVLGLFIMMLAPGLFRETVRMLDRLGPALGFGAIATVGIPILAVIVCLTIVGLAAGISALLLWAIAVNAVQVFVGAWLGEKFLGRSATSGGLVWRMAVGLLVVRVARMVPYVGGFVTVAVAFWGMGALALAIYRRARPAEPAAAPAPAV